MTLKSNKMRFNHIQKPHHKEHKKQHKSAHNQAWLIAFHIRIVPLLPIWWVASRRVGRVADKWTKRKLNILHGKKFPENWGRLCNYQLVATTPNASWVIAVQIRGARMWKIDFSRNTFLLTNHLTVICLNTRLSHYCGLFYQ